MNWKFNRTARLSTLLLAFLIGAAALQAKIDLTTLPDRDRVQLTIYNAADLTLAREARSLTLSEGENRLEFSWANTLIDPTSLELLPISHGGQIDVTALSFPPNIQNSGVWTIDSQRSGETPIEINYFTSGISWRAFYMGTLSQNEKTLDLEGYVRVTNKSGEDYENAQVRLVVGKMELLDEIAELAKKSPPYGVPGRKGHAPRIQKAKIGLMESRSLATAPFAAPPPKKEVAKEGLSEYQLYTIEGTETIPTGWSKRLPSFSVTNIPVENLYKYDAQRYNGVQRFLSFVNDEEHELGDNPIPGGDMRVLRKLANAENAHLSFEGESSFQYIPIGEDVELSLGRVSDVIVDKKLMEETTSNLQFNDKKELVGWDETNQFSVEIKNTRTVAAKVEITVHMNTTKWELAYEGDYGAFEKIDADSVRFTQSIPPQSNREFTYTVTWGYGTRAD